VHLLHTMQPPVRQFPLDEERHESLTSPPLDPLLQFDSEDRSVARPAHGGVSERSSSSSLSAFRSESVRPPQKVTIRPAPRSKAASSVWRVGVRATFGSVLVVVILVLMNFPSPITLNPLLPPLPASPAAPTRASVALGTDTTPFVPVTPVHEEKPVAPVSAKPRSPVSDASVTPPIAGRQIARVRFYGSLVIDSVPVSARAFINGELVGVTPLVLTEVPVGSRAIRLEADDHSAWSSTVRVVAGQQTRVSATLTPSR
jgi:hypothetical protein